MKNQKATLLLAVILAVPAFAFADNIPGHSRIGNTYVNFSAGSSGQLGSQSGSAPRNFLMTSVKTTGVATLNTGVLSDSDRIKLVGVGGDQGASSDKDKDKVGGKQSAGDGDSPSATSVSEPGSQALLLFGLAAVGIFFYRRKTLTNAI